MTLKFTKMHGLGNDFIIIDAVRQPINLNTQAIIALAKRNTGIGFDQCLIVEPSTNANADFFYRIFNANGQEVGQCGNGARCLARFLSYYKLTEKKTIRVATKTTVMNFIINNDDNVTIEMNSPQFNPKDIPFQARQRQVHYDLPIKTGEFITIHALNVGNPHAVCVVSDVTQAPVISLGKEISLHPMFPEQTNTGFMEIIDNKSLRLRVYERGCGETQACGSGAVAAAAVGRLFYQMSEDIQVELPGGKLLIHWLGEQHSIFLTGPATFVYEGNLLVCA